MAKGQKKRSSREPKQPKSAKKPAPVAASSPFSREPPKR